MDQSESAKRCVRGDVECKALCFFYCTGRSLEIIGIFVSILSGHAVTICVYMNQYLFYNSASPNAGDSEYDHIVSAISVESKYDDDQYHDDDILTFSDHGEWSPVVTGPQYLFSYTFLEIQGTRMDANAQNGNVYTINSDASVGNFGILHSGVADENKDTLPVRVTTNLNYESPDIKPMSNVRPAAMALKLTVQVSGLINGTTYKLYRYDDETVVPTSKFNAASSKSGATSRTIVATGATFTVNEDITSDQKVIYRAVRADAP
jgi:hypothetical protein